MNPALQMWLTDAAILLALALLAFCAAYALALIIAPRAAVLMAGVMNRRFSGRRALRPLEIPRRTERLFYRHHRLVGSLLLVAVALFFVLYVFSFPREAVLSALSARYGKMPSLAFVQAVEIFFVLANILIGALGLVVLLRPSLLKPFEAQANRWISTRQALKGIEREHEPLDRFAVRYPRLTGAVLLLGVIYVTVGLLFAIR